MKAKATAVDEIQSIFGANVRTARLLRRMSQEALAESAGLHPNYLSSVERGERNVSIRNIQRLVTALGVDVAALFDPNIPEKTGKVKPKARVR